MTNIHAAVQDVDRVLSRIRRHFLYSDELADRVMEALQEDALAHSNRLEPDSDNAKTLRQLNAAWDSAVNTFPGFFDENYVLDVATHIHPGNHHSYREGTAKLDGRRQETPYILTNPAKIKREMDFFYAYLNQSHDHPIIKAAALHLYFVLIHPLGDGNGRSSRLLQNVYLHHQKYPPALVPHSERNTYLNHVEDALLAYRTRISEGGERFGKYAFEEYRFFEYIAEKVLATAGTLERRIADQKKYLIEADIRGSSKRGINAIRGSLQRTFRAHGVIASIDPNYDDESLEVITSASRECIVGSITLLREGGADYIKNCSVIQMTK